MQYVVGAQIRLLQQKKDWNLKQSDLGEGEKRFLRCTEKELCIGV